MTDPDPLRSAVERLPPQFAIDLAVDRLRALVSGGPIQHLREGADFRHSAFAANCPLCQQDVQELLTELRAALAVVRAPQPPEPTT